MQNDGAYAPPFCLKKEIYEKDSYAELNVDLSQPTAAD